MSKGSALLKNTIIIGLGRLSVQVVAFILIPIYTTFLTPSQYGFVDLVITYVALLAPLLSIQLERAAFRFLIDARSDTAKAKQIISQSLAIAVVTLFMAAIVYAIVTFFIDIPYAALIAVVVVATVFSNIFLQIARGLGYATQYAAASGIAAASTLGAIIWLVIFEGSGITGVFIALTLASVVPTLYLLLRLRLYRYITLPARDMRLSRELIGYAWPLIPNSISWWLIKASDRTLISIILGVAANGIYAVVNRYTLVFHALYAVFEMSWQESASMHINSKDRKDRDAFFSAVYSNSFKLFGSLGLLIIAATPLIFPYLVGEEFQEAYTYIPILLLAAFFNAVVSLYGTIYIAKKMTRQVLHTSLGAAGMSIGLNILLLPHIGLFAPALAATISFFSMAIFRHYDVKKYVTVTYDVRVFIILMLAYIATSACYYINDTRLNAVSMAAVIVLAVLLTKDVLIKIWQLIRQRSASQPL